MNTIHPKKFSLLLRVSISILLLGALFKIMHWPNSNQLLLISITSILVLYPIRFCFKTKKETLDYVKLVLVVLWCLNYLTKILHIYQLPIIFNIALLVVFGWWFINEGTAYFSYKNSNLTGVLKAIYLSAIACAFGCIILGVLFKIQHWPYSNLLLVIGVFSAAILVIVDYFVRE